MSDDPTPGDQPDDTEELEDEDVDELHGEEEREP